MFLIKFILKFVLYSVLKILYFLNKYLSFDFIVKCGNVMCHFVLLMCLDIKKKIV